LLHTISETVRLATDRDRWKKITDLNGSYGHGFKKKKKKKKKEKKAANAFGINLSNKINTLTVTSIIHEK